MEYTIDAQGKKLGRIASQAASILMGKNRTDFARNVAPQVTVKIINCSKAEVLAKKLDSKIYTTYSGYPGGLKQSQMKKVVADKGMGEAFRTAVHGMLPKNKLRAVMINNLITEE